MDPTSLVFCPPGPARADHGGLLRSWRVIPNFESCDVGHYAMTATLSRSDHGPMRTATVTADGVPGIEIAYERRGTGEPLLLLHGIGHHRQAWEPVLGKLT